MATSPMPYLAPTQYLEIEREAQYKSEYINGQIYAMAGGSPTHALLALLLGGVLNEKLKGRGCMVFGSDLLVGVSETGPFFYPDLSVVCSPIKLVENKENVLANPTVIIEILSKSTEAFDRGEKFASYRAIETLQEYVLVSQSQPRIETFRRAADGQWMFSEFIGGEALVRLDSIGCEFQLKEVYDRANLDY